jgi:hypothetical protein
MYFGNAASADSHEWQHLEAQFQSIADTSVVRHGSKHRAQSGQTSVPKPT